MNVKKYGTGTLKLGTINNGESKTQQHFKNEVNINQIMKRYQNGQIPEFHSAKYGDFSNVPDYQSALNLVIEANEKFLEMPSSIRNKFNNNPALLINFLNNPENEEEARKLGLLKEINKPVMVGDPAPVKEEVSE
jgi:phage internal scaffolding protein